MNTDTSALSLPAQLARTTQLNKFNTRPDNTERAARLKALLLDLSKEEDFRDFRSIIRAAADSVREKAFGYNRQVTKRKILKLLDEYFVLELDDITDETRISEKEIKAALNDLIQENKIREGKRRRWQEVGKHYNPTFELVK
jgi:hypothetical protein